MSGCNAELKVAGGKTATCQEHQGDDGFDYPHHNHTYGVGWHDDTPGAKHPTPPKPRFYIERDRVTGPRWWVRDRAALANVAWFYGHNAESHAREHADRLNVEVDA